MIVCLNINPVLDLVTRPLFSILIFFTISVSHFDEKQYSCMDFCDISKAFDKVWHKGLLFKLRQNGIKSIPSSVSDWNNLNKDMRYVDTFNSFRNTLKDNMLCIII